MWKLIVPLVVLVLIAAGAAYLILSGRPSTVLEGVAAETGGSWTLAWYADEATEEGACLRLTAPDAGAALDWCTAPPSPVAATLTTVPGIGPAVVGFTETTVTTSSADGELLVSDPIDDLEGVSAFVQFPDQDVDQVTLTVDGREVDVQR